MESALTESQKEFCREYVFDWNATRAYKKAYPEADEKTARVYASRLVAKSNIQEFIVSLKAEREKMSGLSWLKVANEFKRIAFSDSSEDRDRLRALEDIAKMLGYNEPEKTDTEVTIKNPIIKVGYGISNE